MAGTRDALLDAAYDAVVAGNWAQSRMADVARAAGVSRQTLYNVFGSKDALAQALALREAQRFLDGTDAAMAAYHGDPPGAVAAAVTFTLREAADNPLLKAVLTDDSTGLLPFLTTRAEPILSEARRRITSYVAGHWPAIPAAEIDLVAEVVVRLTVSYLLLPTDAVETTAARIGGLVERLLAAAPGGRP